MSGIGLSKRETVEWAAETFGVPIEREEVDRLHTLRDLRDLVAARLSEAVPATEARRCLSSHAFYRLRRALVEVCGAERRQVRPDARLRDLLPRGNRRRVWLRLRERSGLPLPGVEPSLALLIPLMVLAPLLAAACLAAATRSLPAGPERCGLALLGVVLILMMGRSPLARVASRLAPALPAADVRELARLTFLGGYGEVARQAGAWDEREVAEAIRAMVIEAAGLAWADGRDEIRLDDTFAEWGIR